MPVEVRTWLHLKKFTDINRHIIARASNLTYFEPITLIL